VGRRPPERVERIKCDRSGQKLEPQLNQCSFKKHFPPQELMFARSEEDVQPHFGLCLEANVAEILSDVCAADRPSASNESNVIDLCKN
jgi:hypothetical protein